MIHAHVLTYFLDHATSLLPVGNFGFEILFDNAHHVHYFVDEFTPIPVLTPLCKADNLRLLLLRIKGMRVEKKDLGLLILIWRS